MRVQPLVKTIESSLLNQAALASADPAVEAAVAQLVEGLGPALRLAAMELAEQAAVEVGAQLPEHAVSVLLVDGEPSIQVADQRTPSTDQPSAEEFDARITLRLPPSLKQLVEEAAGLQGDSVNGWVVDALQNRARRSQKRGNRISDSFDL